MRKALLIATIWLLAPATQAQVVAEVGGRPIAAVDLSAPEPGALPGDAARNRVAMPAIADYLSKHRDQWELTEAEAEIALAAFKRALSCDPNAKFGDDAERYPWIATALASGEKMQRFIHQRFGGGRLLFQQAGVEAYDATYQLLLHLEREGAFAVRDPRVRAEMLSYWVDDNGSHVFLSGDDWAKPYDPAASFIICDEPAPSGAPSAQR